jgi:branched-chain amino acid transport system permease protein
VSQLIQQIVSGLMTGGVYALVALAIVLIFRATDVINFGQGEMGTLTAFIAWSLMLRLPYAIGFLLVLPIAFLIGAGIERGLIRPLEHRPELSAIIMTVALFLFFNSLSLSIYGGDAHNFKQPFGGGSPIRIGSITIGQYNLYVFLLTIGLALLLYGLLQYTKLGLAMRATAADRTTAELMGVPTGRMLILGWGLATAVGAVAAMLVAPIVVLTSNMMFFVLVFALASAVLGGLDSTLGAVVGGLAVGVAQNLVGGYLNNALGWVHIPAVHDPNQYRDVVGMALIIIVLTVRPYGIFGRSKVQRV